jgi:hypothetical protein
MRTELHVLDHPPSERLFHTAISLHEIDSPPQGRRRRRLYA